MTFLTPWKKKGYLIKVDYGDQFDKLGLTYFPVGVVIIKDTKSDGWQ